jgi:excisionase family DNA binding protein
MSLGLSRRRPDPTRLTTLKRGHIHGPTSGKIFINRRLHVTSTEAAREAGLSRDYLSKLAKAGKIPGHRLGNIWLLDCEAVQSFTDAMKLSRAQHRAELSRMRVEEYRARESAKIGGSHVGPQRHGYGAKARR